MSPRRLSALLLLVAASAAAANAGLYEAIRLHQEGDFAAARKALEQQIEAFSGEDAVTAAEYLSSCELQLGDRPAARSTLEGLIRQHPEARLDPNLFVPELIALAEQVRIDLDKERREKLAMAEPTPPAPAVPAVQATPPPPPARTWTKVSLLTGGVALVGAAVLEGLAYGQYQQLQQSTPPHPGADPSSYQSTGRGLQTGAQIAAGVGVAGLLLGGGLYLAGTF